jgi:hypothetical protein
MSRRIIMLAGLAAVMVVLAAYLGLSHGVRAWFPEGFRGPAEAAQERTLTTIHAEMTLPAELAPEGALATVALPYIDDFEGSWPGPWRGKTGGDPTWSRIDCNSHSSTHSASASGDPNCSTYGNGLERWMVYGPFDLREAQAGGVQFWFDLDTLDHDWLLAYVSTDAKNWCGGGPDGNSGGWTNSWPGFFPVDFGDPDCPVLGRARVWFAFVFRSDDTGTATGAWVDDVCIWRDDPSVCPSPTPTPTGTPPPTPTGTPPPTPTGTPPPTPTGTPPPTPMPRAMTIPATSWANFAWTGDAVPPEDVAHCFNDQKIAAMYRLDPETQEFERWFLSHDELTTMGDVAPFDVLLALNASDEPATFMMDGG